MPERRSLVSGTRGLAVERLVVWLVVIAAVAAVAGSIVTVGEDLRRDVPDSDFSVSFDDETATITVEHAGGDPIRDRETRHLAVAVADAETGATDRVTWVTDRDNSKRGPGYPVDEGDAFTVDDPTVDADGDGNYHDADATVGVALDASDTVRVVWRGTRRSGAVTNVTLDETTLG
jgi:hypothetical protein